MFTESDFQEAAAKIHGDVAAIKAVARVESSGDGFLPGDGRPTILFESHEFHKRTGGKYDEMSPNLSTDTWVHNYEPAGVHQWERLAEAMTLDPIAAVESASWGAFQIMGYHAKDCGYAGVEDFVEAMKASEGKQLEAFIHLLMSQHWAQYLNVHDWAAFALHYNGPGYKQNRYDGKLAAAYAAAHATLGA